LRICWPSIWQRIATNETNVNKWVGGMAQSHGLRSFFTDIVALRIPSGDLITPTESTAP